MTARILRLGSLAYDQFHGITDGSIAVDGFEIHHSTSMIATDIFERMMRGQEFDVAELGLTYYLRSLDFDDPPFIALPVFPARAFRHSAIYIHVGSGIERPQDLAGKTIGEFATYGHDAGVWAKGILADDFGIQPRQSRWIVGGLERPIAPINYIPFLHPDDVDVSTSEPGVDLGALLERGEIDALISGNVPTGIRNGSSNIRRLFHDYKSVEQDWFQRTGVFPNAHVIVARRSLLDENPDLARTLYDAFVASQSLALRTHELGTITNFITTPIPWVNDLVEQNQKIYDGNWWAHGVAANCDATETYLRYHFEQGLSRTRRTVEEIFTPTLRET